MREQNKDCDYPRATVKRCDALSRHSDNDKHPCEGLSRRISLAGVMRKAVCSADLAQDFDVFPKITIWPYAPPEELFLFDNWRTTIIPRRPCFGTISGYIPTNVLEGKRLIS